MRVAQALVGLGIGLSTLTACSGPATVPVAESGPAKDENQPWSDRTASAIPLANPYADGRAFPWTGTSVAVTGNLSSQALGIGVNYLSDLTWTSATNGYGPVELDRSNGEASAGDGKALTLQGVTYPKGLGTHSNSSIVYSLLSTCSTFNAQVGIDDEVGNLGSVIFEVYGDGVKLYDSGAMTGADATKAVNIDISGRSQLRLVVDSNGILDYDHADWADAKVTCTAPTPTSEQFVSDLSPSAATNGWGPVEKDKSNGENQGGDGKPLTIQGVVYAKGLGVHANSSVSYPVNKNCSVFTAQVGIDDEVGNLGNVLFQVYGDGVKLYDSGAMTGADAAKSVSVDLTGKTELKLVVDGNGGIDYDHADWGNAKIGCTVVSATDSIKQAIAILKSDAKFKASAIKIDDTTAIGVSTKAGYSLAVYEPGKTGWIESIIDLVNSKVVGLVYVTNLGHYENLISSFSFEVGDLDLYFDANHKVIVPKLDELTERIRQLSLQKAEAARSGGALRSQSIPNIVSAQGFFTVPTIYTGLCGICTESVTRLYLNAKVLAGSTLINMAARIAAPKSAFDGSIGVISAACESTQSAIERSYEEANKTRPIKYEVPISPCLIVGSPADAIAAAAFIAENKYAVLTDESASEVVKCVLENCPPLIADASMAPASITLPADGTTTGNFTVRFGNIATARRVLDYTVTAKANSTLSLRIISGSVGTPGSGSLENGQTGTSNIEAKCPQFSGTQTFEVTIRNSLIVQEVKLFGTVICQGVTTMSAPIPNPLTITGKVGFNAEGSIAFANTGTQPLNHFETSLTGLKVEGAGSNRTLAPGQTYTFNNAFPCITVGTFPHSVSIVHNASNLTSPIEIPVTVNCLDSGVIASLPSFIYISGVTPGAIGTSIPISNIGKNILNYSIEPHSQISFSKTSGSLNAASNPSELVSANYTCIKLEAFKTAIVVKTNDPARSSVTIPVYVKCFSPYFGNGNSANILEIQGVEVGGGGGVDQNGNRICSARRYYTATALMDGFLDKNVQRFVYVWSQTKRTPLTPLNLDIAHAGDNCGAEAEAALATWIAAREPEAYALYVANLEPYFTPSKGINVACGWNGRCYEGIATAVPYTPPTGP